MENFFAMNLTEQEIIDFDLIPYKHLMEKDSLPCIMTTHSVCHNK